MVINRQKILFFCAGFSLLCTFSSNCIRKASIQEVVKTMHGFSPRLSSREEKVRLILQHIRLMQELKEHFRNKLKRRMHMYAGVYKLKPNR